MSTARETCYGKGDTPRPIDKKVYGERIEAIFGKKELPTEFKSFSKVYGNADVSRETFFIPDISPIFNRGLGMVTYGTRDAEKQAKRKGLIPVGDAKKSEIMPQRTDTITPILTDGMAKLRAYRNRRG